MARKKNVFICKQHFDASSYKIPVASHPERIYLKPDAIPSDAISSLIMTTTSNDIGTIETDQDEQSLPNLEARNLIDTSINEPIEENIAHNNEYTVQTDSCNTSSKRKRKQGHNIPEKRPRLKKLCYVGDINLNNFQDIEQVKQYWKLATSCIENLRKTNKVLRKKCQRYNKKIINLNSLLNHLEQDKIISEDIRRMLNVGTIY